MKNEKTPNETKAKATHQTSEKKPNAKAKEATEQKSKAAELDKFGFKKGSNRSVFAAVCNGKSIAEATKITHQKTGCKMGFGRTLQIMRDKKLVEINSKGVIHVKK